jgi:glycosyltransferase involved in cell wall biosynthesis
VPPLSAAQNSCIRGNSGLGKTIHSHRALSSHAEPHTDLLPTPEVSAGLPESLLYATSAGLGGSGLDTTSIEGLLASHRGGFLDRAYCYANRQKEIPSAKIRSLQLHPVRLLSCLGSADYYAAKKHYLDWTASRAIRGGRYDFFHGWSGECFRSLVEARLKDIPSVMDVPTWHRNKGIEKNTETRSEREARLKGFSWKDWRQALQISRMQNLTEYDLADVLLMPSHKSAATFLAAGVSEKKLHYVGRGVDTSRYQPGEPPDLFRVCFVGALIERKGVHHLLAAWKKLNLANAELILVGSLHEEMKPHLAALATNTVKLVGFTSSVQDELRRSSVFAFPSECEGFAKVTIEAAACALPLIGTLESGDAIIDGQTGHVIPPNDPAALAAALEHAFNHRDQLREMGLKARALVERQFTWDHYRNRILEGYTKARTIH